MATGNRGREREETMVEEGGGGGSFYHTGKGWMDFSLASAPKCFDPSCLEPERWPF